MTMNTIRNNGTPVQMIEALREVMARGLRMQVLT